jgi:hypothetical protein
MPRPAGEPHVNPLECGGGPGSPCSGWSWPQTGAIR